MPLRLRLTLLYTALLAVVLAVFGFAAYWSFSRSERAHMDDVLRDRAAEIQRSARLHSGAVVIRELSIGIPGTYIQVVGPAGEVVLRSEALGPVELPRGGEVVAVAQGRRDSFFETIVEGNTPAMRMLVVPVQGAFGEPHGAVQIAVPVAEVGQTLSRLRLVLMLAGLGGLALAAGVGWRMAYTALRPVEDIARAAAEIGLTKDLNQRVPAGGEDEVGKLAEAFNGMLDRLQAARDELERTLEGQKQFLADVSHELRTPLTTMRGNLEVTLRRPDLAESEKRAAIADALAEAERMSRMVEDLLDLTRTLAAHETRAEPVPLAAVVSDAVTAARPRANGLALTLDLHAEPTVSGDPDKLRRLVDNLIDNALKYTAAGEVEVGLRRENGVAVVTVRDTGPGMTAEEAARAFERFWRGDRARGEPGSGLGLAIARAVAAEHGGSLSLDSAPGKGSTFTLRLPLLSTFSDSDVIPEPLKEET
jgi:signal transduction histidine kinase